MGATTETHCAAGRTRDPRSRHPSTRHRLQSMRLPDSADRARLRFTGCPGQSRLRQATTPHIDGPGIARSRAAFRLSRAQSHAVTRPTPATTPPSRDHYDMPLDARESIRAHSALRPALSNIRIASGRSGRAWPISNSARVGQASNDAAKFTSVLPFAPNGCARSGCACITAPASGQSPRRAASKTVRNGS